MKMVSLKGVHGPTELEDLLSIKGNSLLCKAHAVCGVAFSKLPNVTGIFDGGTIHNTYQ
jgi:hypothetical protein